MHFNYLFFVNNYCYFLEKYTDIATILESEIFNIEKNELTKAYREKVNTIKMKLKVKFFLRPSLLN